MIDYGLADFEARYAAGMIGDAASKGTPQAPKEESFHQRRKREKEVETDPAKATKKSLSLKMNVIPKVTSGRSLRNEREKAKKRKTYAFQRY